MNIRQIIITTLTANTGCGICSQESAVEEFDIDRALSEDAIDEIMEEQETTNLNDISCEEACLWGIPYIGLEMEIQELQTCVFTLDSEDSAAEPTGSLKCSGTVRYIPTCKGRRPIGHIEISRSNNTLGEYFAHSAHLESASVLAFIQLAGQLTNLNAPKELVSRCRQAAVEEIEHTRLFTALARRNGETVPKLHHQITSGDLLSIALHNATEGCISETWAALQACWQAIHVRNPSLHRIFSRVALDEMKHAQLAWDLHAWFSLQLSPIHQAKVRNVQQQLLSLLPQSAIYESFKSPPELMPSPALNHALAVRFASMIDAQI